MSVPKPRTNPRVATIVVSLALVALVVLAGIVLVQGVTGPGTPAPSATHPMRTQSPSGKPSPSAPQRSTAPATQATDPASGLRWVSLDELPREASDTMADIKKGPPYRYPRNDGVVFGNREGVLPKRPNGYYHEFTVITPGSGDRGARRIIAGGPDMGQANREWYYTDDHYASFERIRP